MADQVRSKSREEENVILVPSPSLKVAHKINFKKRSEFLHARGMD
jgi:hypothetical protein